MSQCPEAKSKLLAQVGFDDQLSGNVPPGYTESLRDIDEVGRSLVLNYHQLAYSRELWNSEKRDYVAAFLHASLIRHSSHASVFLSKQSVLILWDMAWVYGNAAAVNKENALKQMADGWEKDLQLNDGPLGL